MLKRFLLSFFIFITVFISSYAAERKLATGEPTGEVGNFSWDSGAYRLEELSREITPPAADCKLTPHFQPDYCSDERLSDILKSLDLIDKKKLAFAIKQELYAFLEPLEISFSTEYPLEQITSFLAESIVNAHVTGYKKLEVRPYSLQDILRACIYFEKIVIKMVETESNFKKYFGNIKKNAPFLLTHLTRKFTNA